MGDGATVKSLKEVAWWLVRIIVVLLSGIIWLACKGQLLHQENVSAPLVMQLNHQRQGEENSEACSMYKVHT